MSILWSSFLFLMASCLCMEVKVDTLSPKAVGVPANKETWPPDFSTMQGQRSSLQQKSSRRKNYSRSFCDSMRLMVMVSVFGLNDFSCQLGNPHMHYRWYCGSIKRSSKLTEKILRGKRLVPMAQHELQGAARKSCSNTEVRWMGECYIWDLLISNLHVVFPCFLWLTQSSSCPECCFLFDLTRHNTMPS